MASRGRERGTTQQQGSWAEEVWDTWSALPGPGDGQPEAFGGPDPASGLAAGEEQEGAPAPLGSLAVHASAAAAAAAAELPAVDVKKSTDENVLNVSIGAFCGIGSDEEGQGAAPDSAQGEEQPNTPKQLDLPALSSLCQEAERAALQPEAPEGVLEGDLGASEGWDQEGIGKELHAFLVKYDDVSPLFVSLVSIALALWLRSYLMSLQV